MLDIRMTPADLGSFLRGAFPQVSDDFGIEEVTAEGVRVRLLVSERHLRPGGTVSGPSMFALADVGAYLAILSRLGPVELAVTTNCSIDFMRKPAAGADMIGETRLLKLGRSLAVCDVHLRSDGEEALAARATLTYAIPPR